MRKFIYTIAEMVETTQYLWYAVGVIAIIFLIIAHYGLMGFNWKWFLFFEFPLYCFIFWAFYATYNIYKMGKEINKN